MARDPLVSEDAPLQAVLDALNDIDCRTIIRHLEEPMTAKAIAEATDVPLSTTYRKLELLSEAGLVAEGTQLREDGHHASRYELDFESVIIGRTDDELEVAVARAPERADERLASLWSEVREEL